MFHALIVSVYPRQLEAPGRSTEPGGARPPCLFPLPGMMPDDRLVVTRMPEAPGGSASLIIIHASKGHAPADLLNCMGISYGALCMGGSGTFDRSGSHAHPASPPVPPFWQNFFSNGLRTWVVVPTPVFFQWEGRKLRIRDVLVNEFSDFTRSPELAGLVRRFGPPTLYQNYSVASDTMGALSLVQYLASRGRNVLAGSSGDIAVESFIDHNIIFFGIPATSSHLRALLGNTNFTLGSNANEISNREPLPGEPAVFRGREHSPKRVVRNGIVSVLPGKGRGARLLLLAGPRTSALVSALTSPAGLDSVHKVWRGSGSPQYFEMVVETELDDARVLRVKPLAIRPLAGNP